VPQARNIGHIFLFRGAYGTQEFLIIIFTDIYFPLTGLKKFFYEYVLTFRINKTTVH
jgi:hypothetical protein